VSGESAPPDPPDDGVLDRLPFDAAQVGLLAVIASIAFLYTPLFVTPPDSIQVFLDEGIVFLVYAMILVGLNLQFGHAGLVNFGPVAFFLVGGYTAAMLTANDPFFGVGLGYPWVVGLVAGVLAAMALGVVVGTSTLRLRDDFLAIVTLAVAEIAHGLLTTFRGYTGGSNSLQNVPQPVADMTGGGGGTELFSTVLVFGAVALFLYGVVHRITEAPYGRVLRAIRADQEVTETLGKRVFRYKLVVFIYGAALAGLAGVLYVFYFGSAAPGNFTIDVTVAVWVGMLVGGAGSNRGVLGGLALVMGFRLLTRFANDTVPGITSTQFASMRLMLVGLLLMVIIRYRPQGIWGNADELGVDS
jgi:branched-chain amino acid transport system permease protein